MRELDTEMLNMREKSDMQSRLAANTCKLEHSLPSTILESEPENVLNTRSPGRCSRWILPSEMETPDRPTSSGLQSPMGAPVQLGPSPQTREHSHPSPCCIPPAQWGDMCARDPGEEECEFFGDVPSGHDGNLMGMPLDGEEHQDELDNAAASRAADSMAATLEGPRCVNGQLVRPRPPNDDSPSTACRPNVVSAPGGVALGQGPPGFGQFPGRVPSHQIAPPPPLYQGQCLMAMPLPMQSHIRESGHHCIHDQKRQEEAAHQMVQEEAQGREQEVNPIQHKTHTQEEEQQGPMVQEEHSPQEGIQAVVQAAVAHLQAQHLHSRQEEQLSRWQSADQGYLLHLADTLIHGHPWIDQEKRCRSFHYSNYGNCGILDTQQILEAWYDKSTFAIATWRGDAQRYWLTQVLDVQEHGMIIGFKALHHKELLSSQPISWEIGNTFLKHRMQLRVSCARSCSMRFPSLLQMRA